jgi:KEOPS complex subunit Cgi121
VIRKIDEYNKHIAIICIRVPVIGNVDKFISDIKAVVEDNPFQVFNADRIAGWKHLFFATVNALNAFKHDRNKTKTLQMEILLYASGERQIHKAIELLGIREKAGKIALIMLSEDREKLEKATDVLVKSVRGELSNESLEILTEKKFQEIRAAYNISDAELKALKAINSDEREALTKLVIERGALLSIGD